MANSKAGEMTGGAARQKEKGAREQGEQDARGRPVGHGVRMKVRHTEE